MKKTEIKLRTTELVPQRTAMPLLLLRKTTPTPRKTAMAQKIAARCEWRARFVRATQDRRGSVGRDVGEPSGNSVARRRAWQNCAVRNTDATAEEKLTQTKNTTKTISHRVGDRANAATRKSPGSGREASGLLLFGEMSLVGTSVKPPSAKEVAVWRFSPPSDVAEVVLPNPPMYPMGRQERDSVK